MDNTVILGIDVGSSSVKMTAIEPAEDSSLKDAKSISGIVIENHSLSYPTLVRQGLTPGYHQQCPSKILATVQRCLKQFKDETRDRIMEIAICGQMHGIILWTPLDRCISYDDSNQTFGINEGQTSDLYTWQDQRCSAEFLSSLPKSTAYPYRVSTGFGCATLCWLKAHQPHLLDKFKYSGTIMDFLVAIICGLGSQVLINEHNATSWGYYDWSQQNWSSVLLQDQIISPLLPKPVSSGTIAGTLTKSWCGLNLGVKVYVAMGDMQCSTYANLRNDRHTAVLNYSTSMQLCYQLDEQFRPPLDEFNRVNNNNDPTEGCEEFWPPGLDFFPYFEGRWLAVAASLNGGNVFDLFVECIRDIVNKVGQLSLTKGETWKRVGHIMNQDHITNQPGKDQNYNESSDMKVAARVFGERYAPNDKYFTMMPDSCDPSKLTESLVNGTALALIDNVLSMLPLDLLLRGSIKRLLCTGSAVHRNLAVKQAILTRFSQGRIRVDFMEGADADFGAALFIMHQIPKH